MNLYFPWRKNKNISIYTIVTELHLPITQMYVKVRTFEPVLTNVGNIGRLQLLLILLALSKATNIYLYPSGKD